MFQVSLPLKVNMFLQDIFFTHVLVLIITVDGTFSEHVNVAKREIYFGVVIVQEESEVEVP